MADLFNNPSNDYVNPGLNPCRGYADESYLEFFNDENIGILKGINTVTYINFKDFKEGVSDWSQQSKILRPGEISFVSGPYKGLLYETHVFPFPTSVSNITDTDKQFFMGIEASIYFYKNFSDKYINIDVSANYSNNVSIENALNIALDNNGAGLLSDYDPDYITFKSNSKGFDFDITNVKLKIIDASQNSNSPFATVIVNGQRVEQVYTLTEDLSKQIPAVKYPNGAFKGIVMKVKYPTKYSGAALGENSKWIYLHHVINSVTYYEPITVTYTTDVSTTLYVNMDSSIYDYVGVSKPIIDYNFTVEASACNIDTSAGPFPDTSTFAKYSEPIGIYYSESVYDASIDSSVFNSVNIINSDISDSTFNPTYIYDSSIFDSSILSTIVNYSYATNSGMINDSSIYYSTIKDSSIVNSYLYNTDASGFVYSNNNIYDNLTIGSSNSTYDQFLCSTILDTTAQYGKLSKSTVKTSNLMDSSIVYTKIYDSNVNDTHLQDSSLYNVDASSLWCNNIGVEDSSINNSIFMNDSSISNSYITDSSIKVSFIENSTVVNDSIINNTFVNIYELLVNPSTGEKIYIAQDSTLDIDSSMWRCEFNNTKLWDSSINNADLYDSSIYNSILYDSSIFNCTLLNCELRDTYKDSSTTTLYINPGLDCSYGIVDDTSTYYMKKTKTLDVGRSEKSSDTIINAKDYLNLINNENRWSKVGKLYALTTATDCNDSCNGNLINGFYLYNPHDYDLSVDYLVIN